MPTTHDGVTTDDARRDDSDAATPRWLVPASLAYLALPTLIFVVGWTRPVIAGLAAVAIVAVVGSSVVAARSAEPSSLPRRTTASIWCWSLAVALLTGAGGLLPQSWDWLKHNAILRDLVVERWPVGYEIEGQAFQLTYYIGYYLPAAAVGKVAGWQAANTALFVWTAVGLMLAFTWFLVLARAANRAWILVVAVFFSGPDIVGRLVLGPLLGMENRVLPSDQLDWWALVGKYPNHVTSVMWGPHHALGAWIAAGLIVHLTRRGQLRWIGPTVGFCGLLSPFVTIGLLPLVGWSILRDGRRAVVPRLRSLVSFPAALTAIGVLPILTYYLAVSAPLPAPYTDTVTAGFALTDPIVPIGAGRALGAYLLLIVLEVVIFFVLVRMSPVGREPRARVLLGVVTLTMILFPLVRYGAWSDLAMRAIVPSMFVLSTLVARVVLESDRSSRLRLTVLLVLIIGIVAPAGEISRSLSDTHVQGEYVKLFVDRSDADASDGIVELSETVYSETPRFLAQYTAPPDTFFTRVVAR